MMGQAGMMGRGMMGQGGMMGRGMMGPMGPAMMMRMIFALMDGDGDGTISLQEFQAAHERIFKAMDANKDGRLTLEEMQAFMQGTQDGSEAVAATIIHRDPGGSCPPLRLRRSFRPQRIDATEAPPLDP